MALKFKYDSPSIGHFKEQVVMFTWRIQYLLALLVLLSAFSVMSPRIAMADLSKRLELEHRIAYWNLHLPFCSVTGERPFPSKYDDATGQDNESLKCNDGDSVIFNGLLCAAGDDRGCKTVELSQFWDGEWLRSPMRVRVGKRNGGSESDFSNDHALGVWAFIADGKHKSLFERWTNWIDKNPRCAPNIGNIKCIPFFPRYCNDDRCTFKPIDCPLLDRLAVILGAANPICDLKHGAISYLLTRIVDFKKQFNEIITDIKKIPGANLFGGIDAAQTAFNTSIDWLIRTTNNVEAMRAKAETFARAIDGSAGTIALINAELNDSGFARHDVGVEVFLLMKYGGFNGPELAAAARILATKEPQNAFFEYIAHGPTDRMLDQILAKCPSEVEDKPHARFQWIWERTDSEPASKKTMYWDCLFVARLFNSGPIKGINIALPPGFDLAYKLAEQERKNAERAVKEIIRVAQQLKDDINKLGKPIEMAVRNFGKALEKAGQDIGKTAEKAAQDVGSSVEKAGQDIGKTAEKAAQDVGDTAKMAKNDVEKKKESLENVVEPDLVKREKKKVKKVLEKLGISF